MISIHAPRAGCDVADIRFRLHAHNFNPRTPCGVRPHLEGIVPSHISIFQSTHPVRGATVQDGRKGRRGVISIHAPRAGCDCPRE